MRKVAEAACWCRRIDDKLLPEDGGAKVVTKGAADGQADGGLMLAWKIVKSTPNQRHCDCEGSPEFGHRAGAGQPHLEHADGH